MATNKGLAQREANGLAWQQGKRLLERAIAERLDFAFETTLGGSTIPQLLARAAEGGTEIFVWYIGLATADLHVARVRARVKRGGHDIPEAQIRRRFEHSRIHLLDLMPRLAALRVYDNSAEADPAAGKRPEPLLLLHMVRGRIAGPRDLTQTPGWAKPLVASALKLNTR
jgi:predicted ABC-type ATPase